MEKIYDIIVIGAGASGLLAAGRAAQLGASVLVIEKMEKAGRKLFITGKGRCNITNMAERGDFIKHVFPNGRYLKHAFSSFFNTDIVDFLNKEGVKTVEERGNRVFPKSNRSSDVVNTLLKFAKRNGAQFVYKADAIGWEFENDKIRGVRVMLSSGKEIFRAKHFIICMGGKSYPATGSTGDGYSISSQLGHSIIPVRPSLVPIMTEGLEANAMRGLTLKNVKAVVWADGKKIGEKFGELLFMQYGISGPIILTLSRMIVDAIVAKKRVEIGINFKPALNETSLDNRILRDLDNFGTEKIGILFRKMLPKQVIPVFLKRANISSRKTASQISAEERKKIRVLLHDFRFEVTGYRPFKEAIITAGGIDTNEVDSKTMKSKIEDNIWFAGEILDLDADTGGYNLQIAWSTAWLAAEKCVENLK